MKGNKKIYFAVVLFVLAIVSVVTLNYANVTAATQKTYKTTIIDSDGLEIDVANVQSNEVMTEEEYIKANINENLAKCEKMEPADAIYVKNLIADGSLLQEPRKIDRMHNEVPDSFIMVNDTAVLLYDVDDNSEYYVGYVDTMHNNDESYVSDISFAYTNLWGQTIQDAIYDYDTGLAYVPKKYTAENKNGAGALNVQIELLQIVNSQTPNATFNVTVEKDDEIAGQYPTEGKITVEGVATEFGVKIALDQEARNTIDRNYFTVNVNDYQLDTDKYDYYPAEGILVIKEVPNVIENLKINISKENIDYNTQGNYGIQTMSTWEDIEVYNDPGVWQVDGDLPQEGSVITIKGREYVTDVYYASQLNLDKPIYNEATDSQWKKIVEKLNLGQSIDLNNLSDNRTWIQHNVRIHKDFSQNGVTIPGGTQWWLKCIHNSATFTTEHGREYDTDDGGDPRFMAWEARVRFLKVTDDYFIVGMYTSVLGGQAGAGIYKIAYGGATGNLQVGKKDDRGNWVAGARLRITGPDGFNQEITTVEGPTLIEKVKKGTYTVEEIQAPDKMIINRTPQTAEVVSNGTAEAYITDTYPKGSVRIVKFDLENRGNTKGDAKLEGAVFKLLAREDIYEGKTKIYSAGDTVKDNIVTDATGNTPAVTNLPLGKYYYIETKAPEGFVKSDAQMDVEVTYKGQDTPVIPEVSTEMGDKEIKGNILINKTLGETDYDPQIPLEGAQFTITLKNDPSQVYTTNVSGADGACSCDGLPYGLYTVRETKVPDVAYRLADFEVFIQEDGKTYTFDVNGSGDADRNPAKSEDKPKEMKIEVTKELLEEFVGRTDASVAGACFTVYTDPECKKPYIDKNGSTVVIGPTDENGYAISGTMRTDTYYIKETTFPVGIDEEHELEGEAVKYKDKIYEVQGSNTEQDPDVVKLLIKSKTIKNKPDTGSVHVIKYDNKPYTTEESPAKGAILRLTLLSTNPDPVNHPNEGIYYDVTINEYGYGEFVYEAIRDKYYPYTIPYGKYVVTEIKQSDSGEHLFIQNEIVDIRRDEQIEYRIESDEPIPMYLKVVKTDTVTGATVKLTGAKFKIWSVEDNDWVTQMTTPGGDYVDEFEVNEEGFFYTPQELYPGDYVVYETQAPKGYYLEDKWRIPTNPADIGKVGGKKVTVNKSALGILNNESYPEGGIKVGDFVFEVKMDDRPLKAKLQIYKTGEMLTDSITDNETGYGERYSPIYSTRGLDGVTYDVIAAEDIMSPDGTHKYVSKGTVVDTITTGADGVEGTATTDELYLGKYKLVEKDAPAGVIKNKDIDPVVLENENSLERVKLNYTAYDNDRQKLVLTFKKSYTDLEYSSTEEVEKWAVFGVYAKEDIRNKDGRIVIPRDGLVDVIRVENEEEDVTSRQDLPAATYYVKELDASYPYEVEDKTEDAVLSYDKSDNEYLTFTLAPYENDYPKGTITLIKLSSSTLGNVVLDGDDLTVEGKDEKIAQMLDDMKNMTDEEVRSYLASQDVEYVAGAEYSVYLDEECTKPLYKKNSETGKMEETKLVTDSSGIVKLEDLPVGKYYLKETYAPAAYKMSEEVVEIELTREQRDSTVYNALVDDSVHGEVIKKTDIFTGDVVPDCTFEITDKTGKVLLHSITDEEGVAYIPVDMFTDGEKYYFQEIEAPEIYDLNTEKHEFTAQIEDGKWTAEKIEVKNTRKDSTVTFEKLDVADSTRIPNCKFELRSLETNFVVEGVTDKDGIYVFEDIPYGRYTYTELEAPDEYILDTEPHELVVDAEEVKVKITNEKAPELPDTGDIAVIALVAVAVVCVLGIVFVVVRNRKKATNRE